MTNKSKTDKQSSAVWHIRSTGDAKTDTRRIMDVILRAQQYTLIANMYESLPLISKRAESIHAAFCAADANLREACQLITPAGTHTKAKIIESIQVTPEDDES